MSDVKWIKVAVDMFDHDKIDFLRSLPEGDSIIVTWIQMLTIAGKSNNGGYLMVTERIPYTEQLLSNKLRRQPVFLQFALNTLENLNMINVEEGPYHITNWEKHQNANGLEKIKSDTAKRVAKHRQLKKEKALSLQCNVTNALHVTHGNETEVRSKNKEKDLKDIVDQNGPKGPTRTKFIPPSIDEVIAYCEERAKGVDPEKWYDHYTSNGWKVGKNPMKEWKAAVRTWERGSSSNSTSTVGRTGTAAYMPSAPTPLKTLSELRAEEEEKIQKSRAERASWG